MSRTILTAVVLGLLLLLMGCRGPMESLTGEYESQGAGAEARLSLRSDGGGALEVGGEEAPFRWEVREDGQVFLHTRQGGIISARQGAGTLELDMPGTGRLLFRKASNQ
ncbi:MAG: hypothetical protein AB7E46_08905 [Desulfovibrio sp.]